MDAGEKKRLREFCAGSRKAGSWPNGAMLTLLDALDAAERERDEARREVMRLDDVVAHRWSEHDGKVSLREWMEMSEDVFEAWVGRGRAWSVAP